MMNCSIADFGARSTDVLQTDIIQKAIDCVFLAGGGTVRIPKGIYRTGDIRLRSNVTLYLHSGAILEGSQNPEDYMHFLADTIEPVSQEERARYSTGARSTQPYSRWCNAIIRAIHAHDIAIIGEPYSWIDGMNCYDPQGEDNYRGPHPICMHFCERIRLEGYSVRRGGNWGHAIFSSSDITVRQVSVLGGHDGFDIRTCDNVLIENCLFDTGDDCIAGFDNHDVTIRDCELGSSCFLFRFGGNNILIDSCRSRDGGSYGFRGGLLPAEKERGVSTDERAVHRTGACFMYYCDFRAKIRKPVENILIRNCEFGELMTIFSHNWNENYRWCCNVPMKQIRFENCSFRSVYSSIYIHADESVPLAFEMSNCDITVKPGFEETVFLDGTDFGSVRLDHVRLHGFADPRIVKHTDGELILNDCTNIRIIEDFDPEFLGPYMDQVLMTEDGPKSLRD